MLDWPLDGAEPATRREGGRGGWRLAVRGGRTAYGKPEARGKEGPNRAEDAICRKGILCELSFGRGWFVDG